MKYLLLLLLLLLTLPGCNSPISKVEKSPLNSDYADHASWVNGRKFSFYYYKHNLAVGEVLTIALVNGKHNIKISKVEIFGSSSLLTWTWRVNSQVSKFEDNEIQEIPLNQTVDFSSDASFLFDPVVIVEGDALLGENVDSIGMQSADGYSQIKDTIITENMAVKKGTTNMLVIKTRHQSGNINLGIKIYFTVM